MKRISSHPVLGFLLIGVVLAVSPLTSSAQVCPSVPAKAPARGKICAKVGAPCSPVTDGIGNTGKCTTEGSPSEETCECKGLPAPSYTLTLAPLIPSSLTDPAGGTANSTITITPANGYTGSVNLTCTVTGGSPPPPTCSTNPPKVTVSSGAVTSGLSVTADKLTTGATYTITVTGVDAGHLTPDNGAQSLSLLVEHHYTVGGDGGGGIALLTLAGLLALWTMARPWRRKRAELQ